MAGSNPFGKKHIPLEEPNLPDNAVVATYMTPQEMAERGRMNNKKKSGASKRTRQLLRNVRLQRKRERKNTLRKVR